MKSNLAYIDDVMDRTIAAEAVTPTLHAVDKQVAADKGKKIIGGFRVRDAGAEQKAVDEIIAKRRSVIEAFMKDRVAVRDKLNGIGITPLAICPTGAWYKICQDTGLFILSADKDGRVGYSRKRLESYSDKYVDKDANNDWPKFLKNMFPENCSVNGSDVKATLMLPDPPEDVAEILCKAQALTLTVAAVSEAIRFLEKPSELIKNAKSNPKDQWAKAQGYEDYADWLKRDPIIFTEQGSATAIIAQFGDFPIEQKVVDAVVSAEGLLATKPKTAVAIDSFIDPSDVYRRVIDAQMLGQQYDSNRIRQEQMAAMAQIYSSRSWTGR